MSTAKPTVASRGAYVWPIGPAWPSLPAGTELLIVKRGPGGDDVTSYRGIVAATVADDNDAAEHEFWVVAEARWINRQVDLDGLSFVPGDRLLELFSPAFPFNAFAVYSPEGLLRGWYANVTYPSTMDLTLSPPLLVWQDLYLDLVALPDGTVHVRDEDELDESGLAATDPAMHAAIIAAKDELLRRWTAGSLPFGDPVALITAP